MRSTDTSTSEAIVQQGQVWLAELRAALGARDDEEASRALRATLHVLRDSLTLQELSELAAQLPTLVRGLFFEGWNPSARRLRLRRPQEFLAAVQAYHGALPLEVRHVVTCVFKVLGDHAPIGEPEAVRLLLPQALRELWPKEGSGAPAGDAQPTPGPLEHVVGQYMSRDVLTVSAADPLQAALDTMSSASVRHLVVLAPEQARRRPIRMRSVVGMLSNRDALDILRCHPDEIVRLEWHLVRDVMTHPPLATISPTASLAEAAERMHAERISALVVVDQEELAGLLTSDDLLYAASLRRTTQDPRKELPAGSQEA